jgi:hypothetical protein
MFWLNGSNGDVNAPDVAQRRHPMRRDDWLFVIVSLVPLYR